MATHFHALGLRISVVNLSQIKYFARTKLIRTKTDPVDARLIQDFGTRMNPGIWNPAPEVVQQLKNHLHELDQLKEMERLEKNRLHALEKHAENTDTLQTLFKERLALLKTHKKIVEKQFNALLDDELLKEKVELLIFIPGIGKRTTAFFMAETSLFMGMTSGRSIAAYAGLSPALKHSGNNTPRARLSKIGNPRLRLATFMAALGASRTASPMGDYYRRLRAQGKPGKVALCALARKLLCVALAIFQSGQAYVAEAHQSTWPGDSKSAIPG
ncbi:transposase [Deinococcus cellulosilyticus]|uniref:Transposase IS116/IS110/IS902 C-terminal domain-containing protein n=1 Tax=Deinococcus cellulosilyticus (strain DSM 18568 / NBRC 106333 / KACC 11606 / 5516J-15) TaxID=1223518 RepID=A0A511MY84_DEIC1|nr:transposase [Deinococcus cellulosilyticus]GEM45542.1 hypothetical protein DC3_11770 [Deinococcus cellulosilyticus NBRC 106333 = KACC 11606]